MRAEFRGDTLFVEIEGRVDGDSVRWVREFLEIFQPLRLVVDLSQADSLDDEAVRQIAAQERSFPRVTFHLEGSLEQQARLAGLPQRPLLS